MSGEPPSPDFLSARGNQIVDGRGQPVRLRGFGLGGWLNMENFITGFPANEEAQRQALRAVLGPQRCALFFERFLGAFFGEQDARFIRSLGLNLVRIALNYRHLEADARPFEIVEHGFQHLDRAIQACARQRIYVVIDLHAAPGYQNQHWHSDNPTHRALLWQHRQFQDRLVHLWEAIATRYRHEPWVAGYDLINEPGDPTGEAIMPLYRRLFEVIRAVDPNHLLFLEGNRYALDFHLFGEPWPNVAYSNHDYALPGFIDGGPYPGISRGEYVDRSVLEATFVARSRYMLERQVPIFVGEFGPVYTGEPAADAMRYQVLRDQLEIYAQYQASWAIWTFKDIGLQGVVYASPDSPWVRRIQPVLAKKARLGVDAWGGRDSGVRHLLEPIEQTFATEFATYAPFPFGAKRHIDQLVRHMLLAEPLVAEFAECFRGVTDAEIDALVQSFAFQNCVRRSALAEVLAAST